MRQTTPTIDVMLAADGGKWALCFNVTLPQKVGEPQPYPIRVAEYAIAPGGVPYVAGLKSRGAVSFSEGSATDGASFELMNNDDVFGQVLAEGDRTLDGAKVEVFYALETSAGVEVRTVAPCIISDVQVNTDEATVAITVTTDLSRPAARVGAEQLSQRCLVLFNVGGQTFVDPADGKTYGTVGRRCAWSLAQGGDPNNCDHTVNGANGCVAHNNLYHIVAVPQPDEVARQVAGGSTGGTLPFIPGNPGGGGDDDGGYPSPNPRDPRTRERMPLPRDL